ncbi:MAG: hypothetical protein CSA09_01560 [Candidatus Contendobacter odensis]|uniref:Nitroreductase n=1 Tax=Candidatus Contendibacter odensensis TaxID=1400860 RepID=A0A2G6PG63_9GAMM|nr:MAG: hypothetical protein CSA09_01560 [Candidatus Contendobacter odensis]
MQSLEAPVTDAITRCWSPRAVGADWPVSGEHVTALLEAARWARSCFDAEPWRYPVLGSLS